jgi:probable rRNA maturation factor
MTDVKQKAALQLDVQFGASRRGVPHVRRLREWAQAAYLAHAKLHRGNRKIKLPSALVSLRIVTGKESQQLNLHWREKDKATNVLSFPVGNEEIELLSEDGAFNLGDLAICSQVVNREAREQQKKPEAHWAHMMIHGVLHLLGYDHETSRDAKVMESIEIAVLKQFGFANPYE